MTHPDHLRTIERGTPWNDPRAYAPDLYEALEPLFAYANTSGIVDEIEADAALAIIRDAFKGKAEV